LLRAFSQQRAAAIRRPDAVRPWQHVLDPLSGYLRLAERLFEEPEAYSQAWNFGPTADNEVPVAWVADAAARTWGGGAAWVKDRGAHPRETIFLRLDSEKAQRRLGWRARVSIETAVAWTIDWQRAFSGGGAARALMLADVGRFEGLPV
jgi:CDP-glucose 4,6-dehydratase